MTPMKVMRSEFFGAQMEDNSEILKKISTSKHAGPFLIGKELGRGITGSVRLGTHAETGFKVALKIVRKKYLNKNLERWNTLRREIAVMKVTEHPNIVKLYDVFETHDKIYLVTELLTGGELFDYIPREGLSRHESLRILAQITSALLHCHEYGIVHRDLKPENLLMDEHHNVKLGDFGMARLMKDGVMLKTSCGSPHYASPEVIADGKYDGKRSDVWSLGVILFAMISGTLPFDHQNIPTLLNMVKKGVYEMPESLDDDVKDLINSMIQVDLTRRIKMEDILRHGAFRKSGIVPPHSSLLVSPSNSPLSSPSQNPVRSPVSSPSSCPSSLRTLDSDGDLKMGDHDIAFPSPMVIEESLLDDLLSLGWDSKDELRFKILQPEPSQEKSLYHHLKRRRRTRIEELHRLSPLPLRRRFYSVTASAPVTPSWDPIGIAWRRSSGPLLMDSGFPKFDDAEMTESSKSLQAQTRHLERTSTVPSPFSPPKASVVKRQTSESPISSPPRQGDPGMASEISLKLFTLANEQTMKPICARRLFTTPQVRSVSSSSQATSVRLPSAPVDSRRLTSIPDRVSTVVLNSPKATSPRIPVHIQSHKEDGPALTQNGSDPPGTPISRWFSAFFRRRPSLDPWRSNGSSAQNPPIVPSPSAKPTEPVVPTLHSPFLASAPSTFQSPSPPSSPPSSSSSSSRSTSLSSSLSLSRERSSSLPTNIFTSQLPPPPPVSMYVNSAEMHYRQLQKKEPKPSNRASSAYLNFEFNRDDSNEETV